MNNDLYYIKYIKYKTKYLNEKNKIGGSCDINTKLNLNILNPVSFVYELFKLLKENNSSKDEIISSIINIYDKVVIPLKDKKKFTKECLKSALTNYLSYKNIQTKLSEYKQFEFLNIKNTSLNIVLNNGIFEKRIENTQEFSAGTALIQEEKKGVYVRNLRNLVNLFNIKYKIDEQHYVESLRFGTPYAPDPEELFKVLTKDIEDEKMTKEEKNLLIQQKETLSKEIKDFYESQISTLTDYIGPKKKCIFISLLDICDSFLCIEKLVGEKVIENDIVHKEIKGYSKNTNIVYLSMPCNNSVNLKNNLSVISNIDLVKILENYFIELNKWLEEYPILKNLRDNGNFFEIFKKNVLENDSSDKTLLEKLSIRRFVLKEEKSLKKSTDNIENFSPCLEDLTNENIRLVMFCYISLIFYFLSKNKPDEYILLYHCKSGQDRTGTFYAINQMVNTITTEKIKEITAYIIDLKKSFIDIFIDFYSLTPSEYYNSNEDKEKKICKFEPSPKVYLEGRMKNINKNVELYYLKYLLFSYIITTTSTGCPGFKWGLTNTQFFLKSFDKREYNSGSSIANRFSYLLLSNPFYAFLFEGASKMRGS